MKKERTFPTFTKHSKLHYSSALLTIFLLTIPAFTGCTESIPEEMTASDTQPTTSDSSSVPEPGSSEVTEVSLQLLISDEFTLGESITDNERGRMFPDIDRQIEEGTIEYPFIMHDFYSGESFFLRERERAQVTLLTNSPACLWEDHPEFESGVLFYIGPAAEYLDEWGWVEGYEETKWSASHEWVSERSGNGWATTILFDTPMSGHYSLYLVNLSKDSVSCEFKVMVEME